MKKKKAFTLAELLITLTMLGIIATLTIPPIVQNVQQFQIKTQLKNGFSSIDQAMHQIMMDNGGTVAGAFQSDTDALDKFLAKMKYIKKCGGGGDCWKPPEFPPTALLIDGSSIGFTFDNTNCNFNNNGDWAAPRCGVLWLDVNGPNYGPNQWGRDQFRIEVRKDRLAPLGAPGSEADGLPCNESDVNSCTALYLRQ